MGYQDYSPSYGLDPITVARASAGGMSSNVSANITVGYTHTPYNAGTQASGTFTPNLTLSNYQYLSNNGAFTLAPPAADGAVDLLVTNGATAGAITFSGFTVGANTGDALTTTNGSRFLVSIRRINGIAMYGITALQ
jgi:hypothetical protein